MSKEWSKQFFANNLKRYMELSGKNQKELAEIAGVSAPTFNEWVNGKKFPRINKVQILADYFGIKKSDLIEEKLSEEQKAGNDTLAGIIVRLRMDADFRQLIETLYALDSEKLKGVQQMLQAFAK